MKWIGIHGASASGKDTAADFIIAEFGGAKISFADPMKHLCRDVLGFTHAQLWGPSANRNEPDARFDGEQRAASCAVARVLFREQAPTWVAQVLPHFGPARRADALTALGQWLEACLRQTKITPRYALQTLGTEWGRAQDPDMWFRYADVDAERRGLTGYAVVSDVRFLNEGAFLQSKGAPVIEVLRPGFDGGAAMAAGVAAHVSEMERVRQADAFRRFITHTIHNDDTLDTFKERLWGAVSPGTSWPNKPLKPSIEVTPSTPIESDTGTPDSSPSTSSIEEAIDTPSLPSALESSPPSLDIPTDTPKTFSEDGLKTTPVKPGGSGRKTGRTS